MQTNKNYDNLEQSYLFSTIARKVREYSEAHPEADIIRLGIGDVTRPLVPAVIDALHAAVEDQAKQETFHGYGDEQGYGFLHEALVGYYKSHGVELATNEIFISDGAKSDLGNILDIFGTDNTVLVPDPVYPVYVDTNVMAGRKIVFADANEANGFLPLPDESVQCDIIYICSPNNPTGAAYDRAGLKAWVDYARTPLSCMTQLTSASSRMRLCRAPFTRSKALSPVQSSSAPSPRWQASPAPAAAGPLFRPLCWTAS